ncbi:TetR/AcrR family transcriptional regulator [Bacillus sp. HSf4]|uniref:TetR/AcrR family transcriptional regulator n=1 Tax=Bacillus sp. HSf4 TaxID=3035514 RepID=UPI002409E832|nr:TetR/AcrR family transcriptional regulator [Bacillus sp. HSf4]WFA03337.1 TetR/AcrR family transcriptional regulator [Bacillus sp. HSf4]
MATKKGEQTKEHILNAAVSFIVREGFEKIGVNKIIKEAGVSKGSFYHYFSNTNDLIKETAIHAFEQCLKDMPLEQEGDAREIVAGLGKHIFHSVRKQKNDYYLLFLCISQSFIDDELKEAFRSIFSRVVKQNSAALQIAEKEGHSCEERLAKKLHMLDMIAIGFIVHCHFLHDEDQLLGLWKQMTAVLFTPG